MKRWSIEQLSNFFRKDDSHEFKPAMAEIEERPAHPLGRIVFWVVIVTMVFFVLWMCIGKVDVVVTARGIVIPDGDVKILQPLDAGVVSSILCREGDYVKKGQVLMEIDPSITAPELESKKKSLRFLKIEKERLDSTLTGKEFRPAAHESYDEETLRTQRALFRSTLSSLEKQLAAKKAELDRTEEETASTKKEREYNRSLLDVAKDKEKRLRAVLDIIARDDYEKVLNEIMTYRNNIEQTDGKLKELDHRKQGLASEIAYINENFKVSHLKEFSDKQKQSTEIRAEIEKTSFKNEKQRILSPADGYVANLFVHTVGGVVTPAQKLMILVPDGAPLIIKATVLNKDIGFIKDKMPVMIKIDTFDFQKYGILKGFVRNVSQHSIEYERLGPVYEVFVTPVETQLTVEGKKVAISSGMSVTSEITVSRRRVIEFFIYPIIKYLDEGIRVR
ncbi:MAG TPA: HlyD family type I secretion periplasmic adaptor subunit [Syntrophorhabdaceae bacterium]|nr:HlyD family type I secretion periplasmic adaptor subunit [Syntrophorhabdaceae bacterium]